MESLLREHNSGTTNYPAIRLDYQSWEVNRDVFIFGYTDFHSQAFQENVLNSLGFMDPQLFSILPKHLRSVSGVCGRCFQESICDSCCQKSQMNLYNCKQLKSEYRCRIPSFTIREFQKKRQLKICTIMATYFRSICVCGFQFCFGI